MKKINLLIILTVLCSCDIKSQPRIDNNSDIIIRVEQAAFEQKRYVALSNGDSLPANVSLLNGNDTLKYKNGNIFRTCEVKSNRLNGIYKMYYPSGKICETRKFKNGFLIDTTGVYREDGTIWKRIEIQKKLVIETYFYKNGQPGKITKDKNINRNEVRIYYDTKFNKQEDLNISYFDRNGAEISKEEFVNLYSGEQ